MACPKCHGSGLIPFVKNDKVVPHAFTHCACHPLYGDNPELERYQTLHPDDFDFPCSDTFRAYSYQYCNQPDLGYVPPEPEVPPLQVIEHRHSDMSKKDFARLQNLEGQVKYLQDKLMEREKKKEDFY